LNLEVFIFLANVEILNRLTGYVAAMQSSGPVLRSWAGPFPFLSYLLPNHSRLHNILTVIPRVLFYLHQILDYILSVFIYMYMFE
jgi:hypothetical protein